MEENSKNTPLATIRDILRCQHGVLTTADLAKVGIPCAYLSILEKRGDIQRVSRGSMPRQTPWSRK